jgi:hypothetical protein
MDVPEELCNSFLNFKLSVRTVFVNCAFRWSQQKVVTLFEHI